jgi:tRNA-splicing ligase RtcB (3'-phosphate/5'-hydroxy nucleic acid ligase)
MPKTFQKITPYKYEITGTQVPITFHLQSDLFPNDEALGQLKAMANTPGVFHHVAVLSDVHPKKGRKGPTGVATAADRFFPQMMDTAPNCGMRMFTAPLKYSETSKEIIDEIFTKLVKVIPTQKPYGTPVSYDTVMDICRFGTKGLLKNLKNKWPFLEQELKNTFQNGNEFAADEIPDKSLVEGVIPKLFLRMSQLRLGILGMAGNHFLDLMRVEKIEDPVKAKLLGIEEDQLIFFMHTGSGILGQYASYFYTPKVEEHLLTQVLVNYGRLTMPNSVLTAEELKQIRKNLAVYRHKDQFYSLDPKSNIGKAYFVAHQASGNFGYANRAMLTAKVRKVVERKLRRKLKWDLIYDMPHVGVRKEKHFGREVFVHRNGTSRANGPKKMKEHPIYGKTGEICFFAGSMTTPSYIAAATDQNESTFFSASHGAGKKKNAPKDFGKEELFKKVKQDGVRLYNAKSKGVVKQYSGYYKDINEVMKGVEENNIAKPIARLVPVAVLMS